MAETRESGVRIEETLSSIGRSEPALLSFLSPRWSMRLSWAERHLYMACPLFDQVVAASRRNDLNVLHAVEYGKFTNGCLITPEFIRVDELWNIIFGKETLEECFCSLSIAVSLKENVDDDPVSSTAFHSQ